MKLWGGRMSKPTDQLVQQLNASFPFDVRLYREDILGSQAWARALAKAGVISKEESKTLVDGLESILQEFQAGEFEAVESDEDIHTAVERRLTEIVGSLAGKLHTGRSRNDQVATDFRLWIMGATEQLDQSTNDLCQAMLENAARDLSTPMPGYTHLQHAQVVTWGHWMLSHVWALIRDRGRLARAHASAAVLPLGSGALAGTSFPIDRAALAKDLGFGNITQNSIDAVSDRDFALDFLYACSMIGMHLSRLAESLILFNTPEFGFIEIDDAYATGSSLMPQKKNPDPLELARGKTGRLIGNLTGLLATLKGLPSAYDKDLQEDKEPAFDSYDTLSLLLPVLTGLIQTLKLHPERTQERLSADLFATDLADYLVGKGVPFREAHALVGKAVRLAVANETSLEDLALKDYRSISEYFAADVADTFDIIASLNRRIATGGTSAAALKAQLKAAEKALR
jgi:argininosuccinate lyase